MIKAIDTYYNGNYFRSRLEARWAVFFEEMGIEYQYEVEGYETPEGNYLPDFYLPSYNCYVEVKPEYNQYTSDNINYTAKKALSLVFEKECNLIFLFGCPSKAVAKMFSSNHFALQEIRFRTMNNENGKPEMTKEAFFDLIYSYVRAYISTKKSSFQFTDDEYKMKKSATIADKKRFEHYDKA